MCDGGSGIASPEIWVGPKYFFWAKCLILGELHYFVGKTLFKAQNDYIF